MRSIQSLLVVLILLVTLCIPHNVAAFMTTNNYQQQQLLLLKQQNHENRHITELYMGRNGKPAKSHEEDLELTVKVVLGSMQGEKEVNGSSHPSEVETTQPNNNNKEGRSFRRFVKRVIKKIFGTLKKQ